MNLNLNLFVFLFFRNSNSRFFHNVSVLLYWMYQDWVKIIRLVSQPMKDETKDFQLRYQIASRTCSEHCTILVACLYSVVLNKMHFGLKSDSFFKKFVKFCNFILFISQDLHITVQSTWKALKERYKNLNDFQRVN